MNWSVLVLTPHRDEADLVRFALVDAGWDARRVDWSPALGAVVDRLHAAPPELLITALELEDLSHGPLLDRLRTHAHSVPILALTSGPPPLDTGARLGGAHHYLDRDSVEDSLVDAIRESVERHRFERHFLATRAADADRAQAESVGRIADGTAFEVNNALAIVAAALTRLEGVAGENGVYQDALDAARQGVSRAASAIDGLLAAGGRRPLVPRGVDLPSMLAAELPRLRRSAGANVGVEVWTLPGLPAVFFDPSALGQVLVLLAARAGAALTEGGEVLVRAQPGGEGTSVDLVVMDDGPPPTMASGSEPPELLRVRSLVEKGGGSVEITPRWPTGSRVTLRLPIAPDDEVPTGPIVPVGSGGGTPARPVVLVVEDEARLRDLLSRALAEQGYRVAVAADEDEARQRAEELGHLDALVTDLYLPRDDIAGMLDSLLDRWPHLALVLMTGAPAAAPSALHSLGVDAPVLAKPFRLPELFGALTLALDEANTPT